MLPATAQVVIGDVMQVIEPEHVPSGAVVYCDPPYLMPTRRSLRQYYRHDLLTEDEHKRFLEWARRLPCRVLISGYESTLYACNAISTLRSGNHLMCPSASSISEERSESNWSTKSSPRRA